MNPKYSKFYVFFKAVIAMISVCVQLLLYFCCYPILKIHSECLFFLERKECKWKKNHMKVAPIKKIPSNFGNFKIASKFYLLILNVFILTKICDVTLLVNPLPPLVTNCHNFTNPPTPLHVWHHLWTAPNTPIPLQKSALFFTKPETYQKHSKASGSIGFLFSF